MDYVFNTRGKDIKNNWPFSQKNLQLCLKHGVKDVLPPFHSLGSVTNPTIDQQHAVDSLRYSDVKYPPSCDHGFRKRPALNIENIDSSECEEDKEFPSTTTSQSCSDVNYVPPIRNNCSGPEARYLRSEKPGFAVRESKKAESSIQSPVKKCRLVVKLNNISEPRLIEDSAVVSETMASKVCPVCKTFSSSSNTTLNAHIDQCLSGESTIKWKTNSKVIKHRIKPRKTRMMVDIYETALCCTLEDLDKRNGTNWASNKGLLQPQDLEVPGEEEENKKTYLPLEVEHLNQEGAVYIDSSGTKLRILSKLNNPPSKTNVNDSGGCKLAKRDKGNQLLLSKKKKKKKRKKHTVQRLDVQKNSVDGQGSCSPIPDQLCDCPPHGPKTCYPRTEVSDDHPKVYSSEGQKEDDPTKSPIASKHMKSDDFGMIKQWVGSKRTGLKKKIKINLELENQCPDKKSVSSLGDRENSAPISSISSDENHVLPPQVLKRKENLCRSVEGWTELLCLRKGPGIPSARSEQITEKKNHLMSSKFNVKQSRRVSTSVHDHLVDPPNRGQNHTPSRSIKRTGISSSPTVKKDSSFLGPSGSQYRTLSSESKTATHPRKMSLGRAMSSGGKKFSSLKTKLMSGRNASGAELKKNLGGDLSFFKKPRLHCNSRTGDEAVVSQPIFHAENNLVGETATLMEKNCGDPSMNRTRVLKLRKRIGRFLNTGERDMTSKGSKTSHEFDSHDVGKKIDSFISVSVPFDTSSVLEEEAEMIDDTVCEPAETEREAFVSFSKSLDSPFPGLSGSNVESVAQYYRKAYDGHCPSELVFLADQEMFCADNVGKNLVTPDSRELTEMDGDEAQGNYFVDVDPIPIPGPPGSFLPSPGRMGSEELLGHSSLTTCRIQSSDDGHKVVDMDSSDSPISAMSTVSNSITGRSSSLSTTNLSAQSQVTEERNNPVVEGSPLEQIDNGEKELNFVKTKANLMLPEVNSVVQNIQPCCCSRKDASLHGGSMDHQELQTVRRRTMTPLSVLAQEKEIKYDAKNEIHCIDVRAETLSEKEPPLPVMGKDVANSPIGYTHHPETMFRDCEFPSPSTSNPVLRLMGKNLTVVNKDDNLPSHSSMTIEPPGVRLCVENARIRQNQPNSFHHMFLPGPSPMFDNIQGDVPANHFDFKSSDPFKIPTNYRSSCHPSTAMHPTINTHEYGRGFSLVRPETCDIEKVSTQKADSCVGRRKEIIIIDDDDSPESEGVEAAHWPLNMEPTLFPTESRHVNPFPSQMRVNHHSFNGSPMVATVVPPSKGIDGNIGKRNCTTEGSSVPHSNSSAAPLPSLAHSRSLYYSHGFL
ncbi:uncharacterized protein LOC125188251 isoform X2 [Salvia hispanica]|uniref:uncharacterized protein LOC125188251 isoform X2 n=1 Tax=Salvia hispanica TaxID=49212 RepID=UPI002008F08C|nr:uncharacterized protein LOC125188251 isoform X2 [Salvia hispanica]